MPHYEQLKCRNNRISLRAKSNDDNKNIVNINMFKPLMIALSIIASLAISFSIIKYYSENIKLSVRNFFKKDKETVEGMSVNELFATNLSKGYLSNFENFKFLIQDDNNTNIKFSIDNSNIGLNKYVAQASEIYNEINNTNKIDIEENRGETITRENIEPFFNYYINSNSITFGNNSNAQDKEDKKKFDFSWNNAFSWIKQKNIATNNTSSELANDGEEKITEIETKEGSIVINTNNIEDSKNKNELESDYFNTVLKPRENKVVVNTMKPAYTPNKYRDEEYIASNNIEVEEYTRLSYNTTPSPKTKKKTVKVEDRYTTKPSTNRASVIIAKDTDKKVDNKNNNQSSKNYNTNYYTISSNDKNVIVINTLENKQKNNKANIIENKTDVENLKKDIPSKEYRKVIEHRVQTLKNDTSKNEIYKNKYSTVITNSKQLESNIKENTLSNSREENNNIANKNIGNNNVQTSSNILIAEEEKFSKQYNDILKNNTITKNDNNRRDIIIRSDNNKNIISGIDNNNSIERETQRPVIERNNQTTINKVNSGNDNSKKIERVKKPQNKNYIYLSSFDEKLGKISLVRRERTFENNNIVSILNTLLVGASDKENNNNIFSSISRETKLLDAFIDDNNTLYINLSEDFEYNPLGSEGMIVAIYQIVYTATQFENIDNVIFLIEGKFNETIGSEGYIVNKIFKRFQTDYNILDSLNENK